jgi:hypothetical protein
MNRKVKGSFFVDYVRMIKSRKDLDWSKYLQPEDSVFLQEKILGYEWYPMLTFERMGIGIVKEIARDNLEIVRLWGRIQAEELTRTYDSLIHLGNPQESLIQFQLLRKEFFNFDPIRVVELCKNYGLLEINYHMMSPIAEQAATYQSLGYFARLLEFSGANNVQWIFQAKAWAGDKSTKLELSWSNVKLEMKVKGTLFLDYVKMLKNRKGLDLNKYLLPRDLPYLTQRINPDDWYPFETFERMGIGIRKEIAQGDLEAVLAFGQISVNEMAKAFSSLICVGDPHESLMRFQVLRNSFFNFNAITIESIYGDFAKIRIEYAMSRPAEEAACCQAAGFFTQLLRLSGGKEVVYKFTSMSWQGDPTTILELRWQ